MSSHVSKPSSPSMPVLLYVSGESHRFSSINKTRLIDDVDMKNITIITRQQETSSCHCIRKRWLTLIWAGCSQWPHALCKYLPTKMASLSGFVFTSLNLIEFMDSDGLYTLDWAIWNLNSSVWSIHTNNGHETPIAKFFKYWHNCIPKTVHRRGIRFHILFSLILISYLLLVYSNTIF